MTLVWALAVSALNGFVALSYQILWHRTFAFAGAGAAGGVGLLLGFYLLGLALGATAGSDLCDAADRRLGRATLWLAGLLAAAAVTGYLVIPALGFLARWNWMFGYAGVVLATCAMGCVVPLAAHVALAPRDRPGARASFIYAAAGVGGAAGSLTTAFVLLDAASIRGASVVIALLGLATAAAVRARGPSTGRGPWLVALVGCLGLVLGAAPQGFDRLYERLQRKSRFGELPPFAQILENRQGVITVTQDDVVHGGGIYEGVFSTSLTDDRNQIRRAFILGAMHAKPRRVLMLGLSTGSWAQVIRRLPGVEELTIVERNPAYVPLVRGRRGGAAVLTDPRVNVVIDDGRRWLLRHPDERFDLVVMNATYHFRTNVSGVLSRELMSLVRGHLAPGGLFYFNTTGSLEAARTAITSFSYALRVMGFVAVSDVPIAADPDRFARVLDTMTIDGKPALGADRRAAAATRERLLQWLEPASYGPGPGALETGDTLMARTGDARVITDDNMVSEWKALVIVR